MKKDCLVYLKHILDAIHRIEKYTERIDYMDFMENNLVQAGVIREMKIIGEATKRLSDEFKGKYAGIPWRKIAGMRDKLIHDYMGVDMDAVWNVVERDMPQLRVKVKGIFTEEEGR